MPETGQALFTAFIFAPLGVMLVIALRQLIRDREPLMLLCIAGGALAMFFEPIVDVLGLVWFARENQWVAFEVFGRPMPLFVAFVYPWYVGGQGYIAYRVISRGITVAQMFLLWGIFAATDIALESPGVIANVYSYYGAQPLNPWGLPLWWPIVNPVMPLLVGALIFRVLPHLDRGWKLLAIVLFIPMADGMANGATAWPIWTALNTDLGLGATYPAMVMTLGLAAVSVWLLALLVQPARSGAAVAEVAGEADEPVPVLGSPSPKLVGA
jgi:hypothetical protein